MSAFLVSERHINTLVTWAARYKVSTVNRAKLADMLVAANLDSLGDRYTECQAEAELAASYRFHPTRLPRATQIVKACDCYDYQACEVMDYDATLAARFVDNIRNRAIAMGGKQSGPDYDRCAWEIV